MADKAPRAPRRLIQSGGKWETCAAYSRAVVQGDWVFVSGTTGFNPKDGSISPDFATQVDQIFSIIGAALDEAGSGLGDIVQVRCFLADAGYMDSLCDKLKQYLDAVRPTNTTVLADLIPEGALIEIEVTACRQRD